jgi:hypothetical protein
MIRLLALLLLCAGCATPSYYIRSEDPTRVISPDEHYTCPICSKTYRVSFTHCVPVDEDPEEVCCHIGEVEVPKKPKRGPSK